MPFKARDYSWMLKGYLLKKLVWGGNCSVLTRYRKALSSYTFNYLLSFQRDGHTVSKRFVTWQMNSIWNFHACNDLAGFTGDAVMEVCIRHMPPRNPKKKIKHNIVNKVTWWLLLFFFILKGFREIERLKSFGTQNTKWII